MTPFYPPPSFYFRLRFAGISSARDNGFQEASGLDVEWEMEEIREGGQNDYAHRLPKTVKYHNLVLRRGFVSANSQLAEWCNSTLSADFTTPLVLHDIQLHLLNAEHKPLAAWAFRDAWPVKWKMSDFRSQENALAIETIEFAFANFQRVPTS
ncbi:phage tail protein [Hymenobacter ruricola]|uniref:Phage tail protein n=1 Tax=Hymenobacter ruricola TaxID=2791023 RepID=A0ABS0I6T6_9BACT|nr:phage tail protein [Hymenobacter ruricola]MBF9222668.1 phage tail protein [Hymenobacter ruricola]